MTKAEKVIHKLRVKGLSARQAEVVVHICKGKSNKAIGESLHVTEKCIKFHLTNIFKSVGVKNRVELADWAAGLE